MDDFRPNKSSRWDALLDFFNRYFFKLDYGFIVMTFSFKSYKTGNINDTIRQLSGESDLVIEAGAGTSMSLLGDFRRADYINPYIRVDLMYPEGPISDSPRTNLGLTNYWSVNANCFKVEDISLVINRFSAKNPFFVSTKSLANALFAKHLTPKFPKKDGEYVSIPNAVEVLTALYKTQMHILPTSGLIVAKEFLSSEGIDSNKHARIDLTEDVFLLHTGEEDYSLFKQDAERLTVFLEESVNQGWELFIPLLDLGYFFMKKE